MKLYAKQLRTQLEINSISVCIVLQGRCKAYPLVWLVRLHLFQVSSCCRIVEGLPLNVVINKHRHSLSKTQRTVKAHVWKNYNKTFSLQHHIPGIRIQKFSSLLVSIEREPRWDSFIRTNHLIIHLHAEEYHGPSQANSYVGGFCFDRNRANASR